MQRRQLNRLVPGTIRLVGVGTGVEPATSRSIIWCSAIELTNVDVPWSDPIHGTGSAKPCRVTCMPLDRQHQRPSIQRDAGGSRTHLRLLCRQPPGRLAPASVTKCSRQESNLVFDLRKVACESSTLRERLIQYPAEESNLARRLRRPSCIRHTRRAICVSVPTWTRTRAWTFGGSNAIRYTIGTYQRADDWIRTSMLPLTRRTPFSVEPRRQSAAGAAARARGFEPHASVLEADCSPRSTLV